MGVLTLLRFLVGDREAILRIAGDRHALWVGLVFVLSAGFAREYDGEDLLAEPWHLLLPLVMSLIAATLMFLLSYGLSEKPASAGPDTPGMMRSWAAFLALFWMTAPLAWLYAVPYERLLPYEAAIDANLMTLGVVATWRVLLAIRFVNVVSGLSLAGSVFCVLLVSGVLAAAAYGLFWLANLNLVGSMGGLRFVEETPYRGHPLLFDAAGWLVLALLVVLVCAGALMPTQKNRPGWLIAPLDPQPMPSLPMILLAAGSLLVWIHILPQTQPEQQRRAAFERAVRADDYEAAARVLLDNPRAAFPPYWVPRLRPGRNRFDVVGKVTGMLVAMDGRGGHGWAVELYSSRLMRMLGSEGADYGDLETLARDLPRFALGRSLLAEARLTPPGGADPDPEARQRRINLRLVLEHLDQKKGK